MGSPVPNTKEKEYAHTPRLAREVPARANLAHIRQSTPDSGLGLSHFRANVFNIFQVVPSSLGSWGDPRVLGRTGSPVPKEKQENGCAHTPVSRDVPAPHSDFRPYYDQAIFGTFRPYYYQAISGPIMTTFPLPYPPYAPTLLPTVGSMDDPRPGCSRNRFEVLCVCVLLLLYLPQPLKK